MNRSKRKAAFDHFIENRLNSYGAMAVAIMSSAAVNPAQAGLTFWDAGNLSTGPGGNIYFNMTTGAANTSNAAGMDFRFWQSSNVFSNNATYAARAKGLTTGAGFFNFGVRATSQNVGPGGTFTQQVLLGSFRRFSTQTFLNSTTFVTVPVTVRNGNWGSGGRGFLGLRFEITGVAHYGWADITVDRDNMQVTLHRFGYNDVGGEDIHAGPPVPEPSSALLLAMGAAGLAAYRRKKKAA